MASQHFAVLGDPIEHSLSPRIHSAAYRALGLDWDYTRCQVPLGSLEEFLNGPGLNLTGMSVTMPLKKEAAAVASTLDSIVELTGVANTLLRTDQGFSAFNTDVFGVSQALKSCYSNPVRQVAILGAGATASSALVSVSKEAPTAQVTVYVRDTARTDSIAELAGKLNLNLTVTELAEYVSGHDLTINTLPNHVLSSIKIEEPDGWLLNSNYSTGESTFSTAFAIDHRVDGKTMLLWQALAQIRIFVSGDPETPLSQEALVFDSMTRAL